MTDTIEPWREHLLLTNTGTPKALLANAITALREAPAWQGVLFYDEFALETIVGDHPPWGFKTLKWVSRAWSPHDDLLTADWLQRAGIAVNPQTAAQAVKTVARDRAFHPVFNFLENLQHDGKARLGTWLSTCLGAEQNRFHEEVGRAMLIAAVARIYDPGCKVDTVRSSRVRRVRGNQRRSRRSSIHGSATNWPILVRKTPRCRPKGSGASRYPSLTPCHAWRSLASKPSLHAQRTGFGRLMAAGNREPRSCVFWGTTNADGYLKDETGGRRFWPVKIGKINVAMLQDMRDQLWAEAVILYKANVPWWLTKVETLKDAERHQRDRYIGDPWDRAIADYLRTSSEVTVEEVLRFALGREIGMCGQQEQNRVARSLKALGCHRVQVRTSGDRVWKYRKPVTDEDQSQNVTSLRAVTG